MKPCIHTHSDTLLNSDRTTSFLRSNIHLIREASRCNNDGDNCGRVVVIHYRLNHYLPTCIISSSDRSKTHLNIAGYAFVLNFVRYIIQSHRWQREMRSKWRNSWCTIRHPDEKSRNFPYLLDFGATMSLVSEVYFLSARPPLKSSTVSLVTVSRRGSPPRLPLLKVLWSVLRTITTLDRGWLNSCPCMVGGIIASDCERGPPTRGDLQHKLTRTISGRVYVGHVWKISRESPG